VNVKPLCETFQVGVFERSDEAQNRAKRTELPMGFRHAAKEGSKAGSILILFEGEDGVAHAYERFRVGH
jgi:hypothetical protein